VAETDSLHVVHPADDALERCRQRMHHAPCGGGGHAGDPPCASLCTLRAGQALLTDKQHLRLEALFGDDDRVEVEATWSGPQTVITAHFEVGGTHGKSMTHDLIESISQDVATPFGRARHLRHSKD
jgi:transposase